MEFFSYWLLLCLDSSAVISGDFIIKVYMVLRVIMNMEHAIRHDDKHCPINFDEYFQNLDQNELDLDCTLTVVNPQFGTISDKVDELINSSRLLIKNCYEFYNDSRIKKMVRTVVGCCCFLLYYYYYY